ncbi:MAG TPA: hypothetical protein VKB79_08345 [Bryobacteraceae bacterium]|nr:hypothetical protein [Bryobacteraceae bacterium]
MTLARRVRALEARTVGHTNPTTLFFADGSKMTWPDGDRRWRRLYRGVCAPEELNPQDAADLDLVRRCVASEEPGGAQMLTLLNALLNSSPAADDETIPRRRAAAKERTLSTIPGEERR